jgi:hypothetical protein
MKEWQRLAVCAAIVSTGALAPIAALAEVLPVQGVYPAQVDAAAPIQRLGIVRFGGRDGETLSFAIEDRLRSVSIDGRPWFQVLPDGGMVDAVMRGTASLEWTTSKVKQKRDVCVEEGDGGKCLRKESRDVDCLSFNYRLAPQIRLVAMDGVLIHADDEAVYRNVIECPQDENVPSRREIVRDLAGRIAAGMRHALAPEERVDAVRVLEKRDGLSKPDGELFKNALRLTKSDRGAACRQWQGIAQANPGQVSTLFNLALCAESAGDDAGARQQYEALLRLANVPQARDRLAAIAARARAADQLADHARGIPRS